MTDEKQIEEMTKDFGRDVSVAWQRANQRKATMATRPPLCNILAEELFAMNFRKLPENAVVLTREEAVDMFNSKADGFMTSHIGDLPLNIDGMRKAVDEITRLINVQIELQELNIKYYNDAKDLKRELKQARKTMAKEIILKLWHEKIETDVTISKYCSKEDAENIATSIVTSIRNTIKELAKQCGVEIEE